MNSLRAVPGSRSPQYKIRFIILVSDLGLRSCPYIFRRVDTVNNSLEPLYKDPHKIIEKISEQLLKIDTDGTSNIVSASSLKPMYVESADSQTGNPAYPMRIPTALTSLPTPQLQSTPDLGIATTLSPSRLPRASRSCSA